MSALWLVLVIVARCQEEKEHHPQHHRVELHVLGLYLSIFEFFNNFVMDLACNLSNFIQRYGSL